MYYYVDTMELCKEPKDGVQWTAWFVGSSQNNPGGSEHKDVIKGVEACIRAMSEAALVAFLKNAYSRAPFIKTRQITEYKGDE